MRKLQQQKRSIECLEVRSMFSASPSPNPVNAIATVYSANGSGNNLANPTWGQAGADLFRGILAANYADDISQMNGQDLPGAREISNLLGTQVDDLLDSRNLAAFIYAWGQFIDHDLDLTPAGGDSVSIETPVDDPQFAGTPLPFTRSATDPRTGTDASNPLNQITVVTSFLDGSMVYGSDATRAAALRAFRGGLLKTSSGNLLRFNTAGLENANDGPFADEDMFLAGDIRANENIELTSLQILFMREHNRQAALLANQHPGWKDEQLYQAARQIVIAEIQSITFNQYLPSLLGSKAIAPYAGYKPDVNPGIAPEFSEAAFRFGHSQLDDDVEFLNNNGTTYSFTYTLPDGTKVPVNTVDDIAAGETGIPLFEAFFNPYILQQPRVADAILKYLASDVAQEVDMQMVDGVRNVLFGAPGSGAGGQDLFALDVQRGRDVGLATYNEARVAYGLAAVTSFSQITSDKDLQTQLQAIYGTVDKVELFIGGLAEDHSPGSSLGATFGAIIANQFQRTRDGDRLWYQNVFSGSQLRAIQNTTLADIIRANTTTTNLQDNVFQFRAAISGTVSVVVPRQGSNRGTTTRGVAGVTINLINSITGEIEATTTTDSRGRYRFGITETGQFQVQVATASSAARTRLTRNVNVTRGDQFFGDVDFTLSLPGSNSPGQNDPGHNTPWQGKNG